MDTPRRTIRRNRRHLVRLHQQNADTPVEQRENIRENMGENNAEGRPKHGLPVQRDTTLPVGVTVTRSGRISKPPERLQINS